LLEVHPEPRFYTRPPKAGLRAVERVNLLLFFPKMPIQNSIFEKAPKVAEPEENQIRI